MKSRLPKIRLGFLVAFGVMCAAIVAFQAYYVWPAQKCEDKGDWWEPQSRVCAVPIPISAFTGRKIGDKLVITERPQVKASAPKTAQP